MQRKFQLSGVVPAGLAIEGVTRDAGVILIMARAVSVMATCPLCRNPSRRVHSRYMRRVADLPCAGRGIRLHLASRRFRCDEPLCRQRIFAERFDHGVVKSTPRCSPNAERLQYEGYLRREDTCAAILALAKDGVPIKQIVKRTGHSRGLVRQVVRGQHTDVFRTRQSSLGAHLALLDAQWAK